MNARLVDLPAPSENAASVNAVIRGVTYTLTELSMERYDELSKRATSKVRNDITGQEEDEIDQTLLMRLMILDCVKPKPDQVMKLGVRYYRALSRLVNELHFGDEPVEIKKADDDEATPKGNAD